MTSPLPLTPLRDDLIRDTAAMARRALLLTRRAPTTLFVSWVFPVLLLVLMSASFARIVMPGASFGAYVDHALPLFVAMGITFGTLPTAVAVHADRAGGLDDRLRTMPVAPAAPLLGRVLVDAARNLSTVTVVTAVGIALGFRFDSGIGGVVGYVAAPLLFGFGLAWPMVALAMRTRSAEATSSVANAVMLVLSFLSTGFVPLGDLPAWTQPIARVNPISQLVEAMRAFAHGDAPPLPPLLATCAWAIGLTVVFGTVAVRTARRRP